MTNAVVLRTPNNKRRGSISSSRSTLTMPSTPRKRRLSTQSRATQTQKQTVDNRGTWRVEKPVAQSAVAIRHKQTMKGFKGKKPKKVKVSKKLRKSVLKVLEAKKVYGNAKIVIHGAKNNGNPVNNIKQNVFAYPISQENTIYRGTLFDRFFLMYVVSRLFNGRPAFNPANTTPKAGKWGDIYFEKSNNEWYNFANDLFTKPSAFKMTVHKLKAKMLMKNNTTRTQYLKMYVCKLKRDCNDLTTYPRGFAVNEWEQGLIFDGNAKAYSRGGSASEEIIAASINISNSITSNAPSVDIEDMYQDPMQSETFKKKFAVNAYSIVLEPGQLHEHWIEGDVGEYDYSKFYENENGGFQFLNRATTDRHVFFTSVPELAVAAGGQAGRYRSGNVLDQICFETQIFAQVSMPETAGLSYQTIPLAGQPQLQQLTQRKRAYFHDNFWEEESTAAFTNNIDDNVPTRQG